MLPSGRHPSDNATECARRNRFQPQCPALIVLGPAEGSTLMVDASGAAVAEEHFPPDETVARYYESWRRCTVRVPTGGETDYCTFLKARTASSIRVNDISGPMLARNPNRASSSRSWASRFRDPEPEIAPRQLVADLGENCGGGAIDRRNCLRVENKPPRRLR